MPDDLAQLMDRLVKDRAGVLKQLGLHIVEGTEMINTVLNGGNPPTSLKNNELVQGLQKISLYIRWVACNLLHADYMSLARAQAENFPIVHHFIPYVDVRRRQDLAKLDRPHLESHQQAQAFVPPLRWRSNNCGARWSFT